MHYTEEQQAIAEARGSKILVQALAGTGKTETTAHRVASLVREGRPSPTLLCFTRAAKDQLTQRLEQKGLDVQALTVHGFAYRVVKQWHETRDLRMPRVSDGEVVVRRVLQSAGFAASDAESASVLRMASSDWNNSTAPFTVPRGMDLEVLRELVRLYESAKEKADLLDFDDLAMMAAECGSTVAGEVIVDEAQDISPVQLALLDSVVSVDGTRTWVGDGNQSIFGFAGVDAQLFDGLSSWDGFTLTQSFRSTQEVLTVPNQLIEGNIRTELRGGKSLKQRSAHEDVAQWVEQWIGGDCAVVGRTREGLERIATYLEGEGFTVDRSWHERIEGADITVSTVHAAKGSEWDRVAVLDLCETGWNGFLPTDEERRLLYVASTRARKENVLLTLDGALPWGVEL